MNAKHTPNLAVDDIPEPGECSPLYYTAMTEAQRAEYDRKCEAKERQAQMCADIHELDTTGLVLAEIAINAIQIPVIGKPIVRGMTSAIKLCNAVAGLFDRPREAHE